MTRPTVDVAAERGCRRATSRARRRLAREFRSAVSTRPSSMRACSSATRSASTMPRSLPSRGARSRPRKRTPSRRLPRAGSPANRWRASSDTRNSGDCARAQRRDAAAPARDRDRGRGGARGDRHRTARARCASPISAPARARCCSHCSRSCRRLRRRHRYQPRRARLRARQCRARSACRHAPRSWPATTARRSRGRSISSSSNPPYVARGDIAGLQPEVRDVRSAARARWRARRSRRLSGHRRPMRGGCLRPTVPRGGTGPGQLGAVSRAVRGRGARRRRPPRHRSCGHRPGPDRCARLP